MKSKHLKETSEQILERETREADRLVRKWEPVIESKNAPEIKDIHAKRVMARLIENTVNDQESRAVASRMGMLTEMAPSTSTASVQNFDPVLIAMTRRAIPQLIAFDVLGVQPMTAPSGLIFALKARYEKGSTESREALFHEAEANYSGTGDWDNINNINILDDNENKTGSAFEKALGEMLSTDDPTSPGKIKRMGLTIERVNVYAKTRKLNAQYSIELAQDLRAVHDLDANTEMSDILSREIIAEENREVFRKMYNVAKIGAQDCKQKGTFNLDVDADGRWMVEKFKGLLFQIEKEANTIAFETKRGRGNFIICTTNVASVLQMTGFLDTSEVSKRGDLIVDPTVNTFAGVLHGRYRVYVDPYAFGNFNFILIGYKGASSLDAGMYYCPYVGLQYFEARDIDNFQPIIGFQTRYGLAQNPLALDLPDGTKIPEEQQWKARTNSFYRIFEVKGLEAIDVK